MRRGTTPTEGFELDTPTLDLTTLTQVWLTICDGRDKSFTWDISRLSSIDNENKILWFTFTQQETLAFATGLATVDIRMLTSSGAALATDYSIIEIHDTQKDGVITNE